MRNTRRTVLQGAAAGAAAVSFNGGASLLTPMHARAASQPYQTLTPAQALLLETLGERLAPTAAEEGISYFVDRQLSVPAQAAQLIVRYLDIPPPYSAFYAGCLAALDAASQAGYALPFTQITDAQRDSLIATMSTDTPKGWNSSFPAPIFYFAARNDAIDVVWGTIDGFAKLGVPYLAHIVPPRRWQ